MKFMSLNGELKKFYSVNDPRSFESYLSSSGTEASVNGTPTLTSTVQCSTRTIKELIAQLWFVIEA